MRVFVAGDDEQIIGNVSLCLTMGYPGVTVVPFHDMQKAIEMIETGSPEMAIVASSSRINDTLLSIHRIRKCSDVPLFVIIGAESDIDAAGILEAGADECVTRLVSPIELLARLRALLRRKPGLAAELSKSVDDLTINFATRQVFLSGQPVNLTPTEYRLLSELMTNEGRVLTNQELLKKVWGSEYAGDSNLIKTCIYRLRSKLEPDQSRPPKIRSQRGVGYRLVGSS